jgi:hypothetical protein
MLFDLIDFSRVIISTGGPLDRSAHDFNNFLGHSHFLSGTPYAGACPGLRSGVRRGDEQGGQSVPDKIIDNCYNMGVQAL